MHEIRDSQYTQFLSFLLRTAVLRKELLKGSAGFLQSPREHMHLSVGELQRRRCISRRRTLIDYDRRNPLHRSMEHDECIAILALELEENGSRRDDTHSGEVDRYSIATLRATHLLIDPLENLLQRVWIKLHTRQYTTGTWEVR